MNIVRREVVKGKGDSFKDILPSPKALIARTAAAQTVMPAATNPRTLNSNAQGRVWRNKSTTRSLAPSTRVSGTADTGGAPRADEPGDK